MKKIFLAIFLCLLVWTVTGQNCDLLSKYGVYDTRSVNISRERAISFMNFLKKDIRLTFEEAKQYSAQIGIPIETVMINLGFSGTEYGYRQFIESIVNMTSYNDLYIEKIVSVSRTINADILKVLEACYAMPGIHARIENSEDPQLSFLVLYFKWEGNHSPVLIEVTASNRNGLALDGILLANTRKTYQINPDEERRISIKRAMNSTIGFTIRVKRQSGAAVIVRSGNLSVFKEKATVEHPTREYKVERVQKRELERTPQARWIGGDDEELKRFETTELAGTFNLGVDGNKLMGNVYATIVEKISNYTTFEVKQSYLLYTAPEGWRIVGFGIENESFGSSISNFGPIRQTNWTSPPLYSNGPVQYYVWQGDSGRTQDQLEGCWIKPALKDIIVLLEKN
jgi:hypothetical protein